MEPASSATNDGTGARPGPWAAAENALGAAILVVMATLPVLDLALRLAFRTSLPGATAYVQNLALWAGFAGAMVAARDGAHLRLSTGAVWRRWGAAGAAGAVIGGITAAVAVALGWASYQFLITELDSPVRLGGWLPSAAILAILPVSLGVIAAHAVLAADGLRNHLIAAAGPAAAAGLLFVPPHVISALSWPLVGGLIVSAFFGVPIFAVLGGVALILFAAADVPVAAIPVEAYRIVVSPAIPTIPLFVLAGYLLAAGNAGQRLVRLFQALFGWMPGGLAIVVTLACAFFSTFTGASGVTILALGGLMLTVLVGGGYSDRFSLGLVTASGSIGLLFPPSLAVILYAVIAHVPIPDLFAAGVGPGLVMVLAVCALGVFAGLRGGAPRPRFAPREALAAAWQAKWEIGLPVVAVGGIFGGLTTLLEAAALTALYAFLTQGLVHREIPFAKLPGILLACVTLIGGVFIILSVAMGLTNYLVDAQIPARAADWVEANIESRILFLLALNLFLLAVGCLMDIYSATVVVVPLILPISQVFGIHPLHLGMIFLVNLELGYLTPPVGMNLFLSAFRFERPFAEVWRSVLPFLAVLIFVVLVVTYVPGLSLLFAGGE